MSHAELLGLRISQDGVKAAPHRVGLLHRRTGIPVFVLFLEQPSEASSGNGAQEFAVRSLTELEDWIARSSSPRDQQTLRSIRPFFLNGGSEFVASINRRENSGLKELLGSAPNYRDRSGLQRVRGVLDRADLVVIPQLPWMVEAQDLALLAPAIQDILGNSAAIALLDLPATASLNDLKRINRLLDCPAVATVYPLTLFEHQTTSSAVLWSGLISKYDARSRLSELSLNTAVEGRCGPIREIPPTETESLLAHRINVFHSFGRKPTPDARFVGGFTLSQDPEPARASLLAQRTLRALQEAILSTCEAFVMEPAQDATEEHLRGTLVHLLETHDDLFEARARRPDQPRFDVSVRLEDRDGVAGFQIQCRFFLPEAVREIQLELSV